MTRWKMTGFHGKRRRERKKNKLAVFRFFTRNFFTQWLRRKKSGVPRTFVKKFQKFGHRVHLVELYKVIWHFLKWCVATLSGLFSLLAWTFDLFAVLKKELRLFWQELRTFFRSWKRPFFFGIGRKMCDLVLCYTSSKNFSWHLKMWTSSWMKVSSRWHDLSEKSADKKMTFFSYLLSWDTCRPILCLAGSYQLISERKGEKSLKICLHLSK